MVKHRSSAAHTEVDAVVIGAGKRGRCCLVCTISQRASATHLTCACAGVVGLAIARALALSGKEVIVLESESAIGTSTSARNSEVVHSGEADQTTHNQIYASLHSHETFAFKPDVCDDHLQVSTILLAA